MSDPIMAKCPVCGKLVPITADVMASAGQLSDRRREQLTRALCGCWVTRLPDGEVACLVSALMTRDDCGDR